MNNPFGGTFLKIDAINDAYSQLRISGLTVAPTPEDLEIALDRLEGMASEWAERNICSQYNFEDEPDPNSDTNVKRGFKQAFATNLAIRLIPDFGKAVDPILSAQASQSLSNLSARSAYDRIKKAEYPTRQPLGSGNTLRWYRWRRFYWSGAVAPTSCKTVTMFIDDVDDFVEHFDAYLNLDDNESLSQVDFTMDSGLSLESSSFDAVDVNYRIKAISNNGGTQQLVIVVTTSTGRVETRIINFELQRRPDDA